MKKSQMFIKQMTLFLFSCLLLTASFLTIRAAGEVDPTFTTAVQDNTQGAVQNIVVQADGKIVVGGSFTVADNSARSGVARFNADGTVDQTFNPPSIHKLIGVNFYSTEDAVIYAVAVQSDGKILVGGDFTRIGFTYFKRGIIRLNADGSLDTSFDASLRQDLTAVVYSLQIQSDGKILVGGNFLAQNNINSNLVRMNVNGSIDTTFNPDSGGNFVRKILIQPDGKLIYVTDVTVKRANSDGSADGTFTPPNVFGAILTAALQSDGKVLIGGSFTGINGFVQNRISRLNVDGSLDSTFNINGNGADGAINGLASLPGGKIYIGGNFGSYNNASRLRTAQLNSDGTLDATTVYTPPGSSAVVNEVKSLGDGRVIIGGSDSSGAWNKLSRINANGTLDAAFNAAIYQKGTVNKAVVQPDGKVILAGFFTRVNGVARQSFARLNADGSLDTGFTTSPTIYTGGFAAAVQADGKILIGGYSYNNIGQLYPTLARLNADGSPDASFTRRFYSWVDEIVVLSNGKIIVGGNLSNSSASSCVIRLNADGSIDNTFATVTGSPNSGFLFPLVMALKVQSDGKIVIGGQFTQINGVNRGRVARLNSDGTLDTTFNPPFGANNEVYDLAVQSNGSVVIGGAFTGVNGVANKFRLARLLADGSLDTAYNPGFNAPIYAVERQADDKILVGGAFSPYSGGIERYNLARLQTDGTIDNSFAGAGADDYVRSIFIQTDSKILIGGEFGRVNGISSVGIARLLNAAPATRTPFDYDGDGRADVSVFRPASGVWYTSTNPNINYGAIQFGQSGDKLVPADYDGDGRTDIAVFRDGHWYLLRSQAGFTDIPFGLSSDLPVPADYDGDGKTDIAVFRPSNATWYLLRSTLGYTAVNLGLGTDKPAPGDYDGDGKAEPAVFRPSNGFWYNSTDPATNYGGVQFGQAGDLAVPADYDGDGKIDRAVFRPSNGTWYLLQSTAGFAGIAFGLNGDLPTAADYDGDGKADVAVFRDGIWYLNRTTSGFTSIQFGVSDDQPTPNSFVR